MRVVRVLRTCARTAGPLFAAADRISSPGDASATGSATLPTPTTGNGGRRVAEAVAGLEAAEDDGGAPLPYRPGSRRSG